MGHIYPHCRDMNKVGFQLIFIGVKLPNTITVDDNENYQVAYQTDN